MVILDEKLYSLFSRGLRFIKELKHLDKLPIGKEEFRIFMEHDYRMCFDLPETPGEFEKVKNKIENYYKNKETPRILAKLGTSFLVSWFDKYKIGFNKKDITENFHNGIIQKGIDWTYDQLLKLPKRYLFNSISAGMYGVCFDYPFGRVEKISYRGFDKYEMKFYKYVESHPEVSLFPKIYTLEPDQVIMEKVDTSDPKLEKLNKYIKKYTKKRIVDNKLLDLNISLDEDKIKELPKSHWFVKLVEKVENELEKIFGQKTLGDFHSNNFGIRKSTGEFVYFDPCGGKFLMS